MQRCSQEMAKPFAPCGGRIGPNAFLDLVPTSAVPPATSASAVATTASMASPSPASVRVTATVAVTARIAATIVITRNPTAGTAAIKAPSAGPRHRIAVHKFRGPKARRTSWGNGTRSIKASSEASMDGLNACALAGGQGART
jgi:hypothetical protein